MILSISKSELFSYLQKQLDFFFPDKYKFNGNDVISAFEYALERLEYCCSHINFRHYCQNGLVTFKHDYSDQYSMFLYFIAKSLWEISENQPLCNKLVLLNRLLHGLLAPYTLNLPNIFLFVHTEGTILGNVEYSDYTVILQNVTVATDEHTKLGRGLFLSAGSKIIGNCNVGENVSIGVNTVVYNRDIESKSIVYTDEEGKINIKHKEKKCKASEYFWDLE